LPKSAKADPEKVAAEIKGMQRELRNLQNALADLVAAMITEEKPGLKEIKKLETLKKKAQSGAYVTSEKASPKPKNKLAVDKREKVSAHKRS
jgi:hypothetical protein